MPAKNATTLPIRKNVAEVARVAAVLSGESTVDYTTKVLREDARKTYKRLGVPFPKTADMDSKS